MAAEKTYHKENEMEKKKRGNEQKELISKLPVKPRKLSKEELGKEILQFISRNKICILATCTENIPRATPVHYLNDGMTLFVYAEGGGKLKNLKKNPNISLGIHGPYKGFVSVKGLQIWGKAEIIYQKEKARFAELKKMYEKEWKKDITSLDTGGIPSIMKVIKITVEKARYLNVEKGIINQTWKA